MKTPICFRFLKKGMAEIHFVDKCLCLIMLVLLLQSAFSLFYQGTTHPDYNNVDIVVRTAAASIFGYFLSANFIKRSSGKEENSSVMQTAGKDRTKSKASSESQLQNIGFIQKEGNTEQNKIGETEFPREPSFETDPGEHVGKKEEISVTYKLQVTIAAFIGLFCLLTLLLIRDVPAFNVRIHNSASVAATVVQFRDFISGCIGFLIGCPTESRSRK